MRALLLRQVGVLELVDAPEPEPGPGEVVVEVVAAGICGSDFHSARDGGLMRNPPIVMGHEFSGKVAERRVTVNPIISCGSCPACLQGRENLCRQRSIIGITRAGGFAERVAVPDSALVDVPDGVALPVAALTEPMAVALHGVRLAGPERSSRVGILGAGAIGQLAAYICARHSDDVTVVDPNPKRRDQAERIGAGQVGRSLEGLFDVVIDAAGTPGSHRASVASLAPGGTAVWIGNESPDAAFDAQHLVRNEQRVLGSGAYTHRDFADAARLVDGNLAELVTERPLDEGAVAMYQLMEHEAGAPIKVLLRP